MDVVWHQDISMKAKKLLVMKIMQSLQKFPAQRRIAKSLMP